VRVLNERGPIAIQGADPGVVALPDGSILMTVTGR
jgi:hypothetical protein